MKFKTTTALAIAVSAGTSASAHAATVFATEGFESGLGNWNIGDTGTAPSANNDTGLYNFNTGGTPVNTPTGDDTHGNADATLFNYATTGDGAFRLENGRAILFSDTFDLSVGGAAESMTIDLDLQRYRAQSTRRGFIEYSNDNGSSWFRVAMFTNGTGSGSVTITEGGGITRSGSLFSSGTQDIGTGIGVLYSGQAFGSQSSIRFIYNTTSNDNRSQFIDNLEVTTTAPVPEPSTTALLGLGGLALIFRRRK